MAEAAPDAVRAYGRLLRRRRWLMAALAAAACAALAADAALGPAGLTLADLWRTLLQPGAADTAARVIVWDIRLPQAPWPPSSAWRWAWRGPRCRPS